MFSNPDAVNITECLANVQPELEEDVELDDFEFTEEDLISALKELDPYSATPDGDIPARILVSCKEQLATPLKLMWTESLQSATIPPSLKTQYITPIFKKGNKTDPAKTFESYSNLTWKAANSSARVSTASGNRGAASPSLSATSTTS